MVEFPNVNYRQYYSTDECHMMSFHRATVRAVMGGLVTSTLVSRTGKPDFNNITDWVNLTSKYCYEVNQSHIVISLHK